MSNESELLEGDVIDVLPNDHSVYVDRGGKTYDSTKNVKMSDLPQSGVIQLPRTTWYAVNPKPITDDLAIVVRSRGVRADLRTEHSCEHFEPPLTH